MKYLIVTADGKEHIEHANPEVPEEIVLLALTRKLYPDAVEIHRVVEEQVWGKDWL